MLSACQAGSKHFTYINVFNSNKNLTVWILLHLVQCWANWGTETSSNLLKVEQGGVLEFDPTGSQGHTLKLLLND